jgi:hypothetical protein
MTADEKNQMVRDILENLPEYAISFDCLSFNYKLPAYNLRDQETGSIYTLTLPKAVEGFDKLCTLIDAGKLHFHGLGPDYKVDAGQWDSLVVDALLQMSVLGEVIYG